MLVYVDSSIVVRALLSEEMGHREAVDLLESTEHLLVSATWTVVEASSALVRAARGARAGDDLAVLLAHLDAITGEDGPITLLRVDQRRIEERAVEIVREHALRSLDALHLAVAELGARPLATQDEDLAIATRDDAQAAAARSLGFVVL